jgi:hypothetical protein
VNELGAVSLVESTKWGKRGGEENEREKKISAEIMWTAIPPDNRREERKSTQEKRRGKERLLDSKTVDVTMGGCSPRRLGAGGRS